MKIHTKNIPEPIMQHYNLALLIKDNHVYAKIQCGKYGLPQAGRIVNDALVTHLATTDTPKQPILQDSSHMIRAASPSAWLLMTLESNTTVRNMHTTSLLAFKKNTPSLQTGQGPLSGHHHPKPELL